MISCLICGTSVFGREENEFEKETRSSVSSPSKSRSKNPYSSRGLDRFSTLLSEIEEKRREIYAQVDPNKICVLRFVYTDKHEFKPIVVKAKHKANDDDDQPINGISPPTKKLSSFTWSSSMAVRDGRMKNREQNKFERRVWVGSWVNAKIYVVVVITMIVVFLVVFDRSFAIMCTSVGWYLSPTITHTSPNLRTSSKNKDLGMRRFINNKLTFKQRIKSFN